jgi:hypothetical protein
MSMCRHILGRQVAAWAAAGYAGGARHPTAAYNVLVPHLDVLPGGVAGRPSPLEIESTQLAGYVHDFANEIKTFNLFCAHRFGRQLIC